MRFISVILGKEREPVIIDTQEMKVASFCSYSRAAEDAKKMNKGADETYWCWDNLVIERASW